MSLFICLFVYLLVGNNMKVFTVTFDQIHASLLYKSNNFF